MDRVDPAEFQGYLNTTDAARTLCEEEPQASSTDAKPAVSDRPVPTLAGRATSCTSLPPIWFQRAVDLEMAVSLNRRAQSATAYSAGAANPELPEPLPVPSWSSRICRLESADIEPLSEGSVATAGPSQPSAGAFSACSSTKTSEGRPCSTQGSEYSFSPMQMPIEVARPHSHPVLARMRAHCPVGDRVTCHPISIELDDEDDLSDDTFDGQTPFIQAKGLIVPAWHVDGTSSPIGLAGTSARSDAQIRELHSHPITLDDEPFDLEDAQNNLIGISPKAQHAAAAIAATLEPHEKVQVLPSKQGTHAGKNAVGIVITVAARPVCTAHAQQANHVCV